MPLFRYCPDCAAPLPGPSGPPERVLKQECATCGAVHYRNAKPTASALVVRDGKVLLARRAIEPFKGRWDIPGGYLEPWEGPLEGVERELLEETGLRIRVGEVLTILVDTYDDPTLFTLNVYYLAEVAGGEIRAADDVAELAWFGPDELPTVAFASGREVLGLWRSRGGQSEAWVEDDDTTSLTRLSQSALARDWESDEDRTYEDELPR